MLIEFTIDTPSFPGGVPFDWQQGGYDYDTILSLVWDEAEAEILAPPPDYDVSEWADNHRILQAGTSRKPGPWRTDYTPYLGPVMDAYCLDNARHIVFCAGTQLGKTETLYNVLGYVIDHDPYPTLMVSPREDDAKLVSRTRVQPMIRECETLRKKMPESRSAFKVAEMEFPGMFLYMVGANSISALASKPARNIFRDEIDKYPERLGKDADPLSKSEERAKSYWDIRKVFDVSSPTFMGKGILKQLVTCDVINVVHHPCPHCNEQIRLYPTQIKYEDNPGHPHRAMLAKKSAVYVCQKCGCEIGNDKRAWMIANFTYRAQRNIEFGIDNDYKNEPVGYLGFEPESIGFWVSSLSSPMLTWGDIAEIWVKAIVHRDETGETTKMQNVINDWYAEPWMESVKKTSIDLLLQKKGELPPLIVPEWAYAVTCGIDVQKFGFWQSCWAWGKDMQSALIHYSFLGSWADVYQLVHETRFQVENSQYQMPIWRAAIDIGGGKDSQYGEDWTKTEEIITWCRENGQGVVYPVKGMSVNNTGVKVKQSIMDKMPGATGNIIPGGLFLYLIDTYQMKENFFWRLENKEVDPQPLELHNQTGKDWAVQITAEEKQQDKNGMWHYVRIRKDNHYLDTGVYAHAMADFQMMGGVSILSEPMYVMPKVVVPQASPRGVDTRSGVQNFQRPAWLNR